MKELVKENLSESFYERMKPRLHKRIGRELRLAHRVLDLGCGSCELVRYLADSFHQQVTGVDISSDSFPKRRRSKKGRIFRCIREDAIGLKSIRDESVDAVVIMWALHEMKHPRAILAAVCRVLRPGGETLVVDFPRDSLAQRLWDENYWSPLEMRQMMKEAGLAEVRAKTIERGEIIWATGRRSSANGPGR